MGGQKRGGPPSGHARTDEGSLHCQHVSCSQSHRTPYPSNQSIPAPNAIHHAKAVGKGRSPHLRQIRDNWQSFCHTRPSVGHTSTWLMFAGMGAHSGHQIQNIYIAFKPCWKKTKADIRRQSQSVTHASAASMLHPLPTSCKKEQPVPVRALAGIWLHT